MEEQERYIKEKEFKSAEELHRFEAGIMLGQMAVFLLATGTLLIGILNEINRVSAFGKICVSFFGIVLSLIFFVITRRSSHNLVHARRRANELARELGYKLYSPEYRAQSRKIFTGTKLTRVVCLCGGLVWLVVLIKALISII